MVVPSIAFCGERDATRLTPFTMTVVPSLTLTLLILLPPSKTLAFLLTQKNLQSL